MFQESKILNKLLDLGRKIIPRRVFKWVQPIYHRGLSIIGAAVFGFPSSKTRVIAVTGTKGKSTTVFMISKILADQGIRFAAIGSLGFRINDKEWPNDLKITLPGRLKLQRFLSRAVKAGAQYAILEATSEGIAQGRLAGIKIDCAVFTNLHKEHIESHGSFEKYLKAKQKLFLKTRNLHVLNMDDPFFEKFANFPAQTKITYGSKWGMVTGLESKLDLKLLGGFNENNALAALAVARAYGWDEEKAVASINSIKYIPGRMEVIHAQAGFDVVIDYAHTPDSLALVYKTLKAKLAEHSPGGRIICVLGAAGGGRDKWKRPEFGKIAATYCDRVILTNEDPYDEDPGAIVEKIAEGAEEKNKEKTTVTPVEKIIDRRQAIERALTEAKSGDIVIITGKGSETTMALSGGRKISWSDRAVVEELVRPAADIAS